MKIATRVVDRAEALSDAHFRAAASPILILAAVNCFWLLGQAPVVDWDEARHGLTAYEMLLHGNWIITTYLERPDYWNLKPPLGHWMTAASFWLLGPSAFALRFMSAAFACATVFLVMLMTRERHGSTEALLAGLILSTTHGFVLEHAARSGHFDAALVFLSAAIAFCLSKAEERTFCPALVGGLLSLAFLLKSFAAFSLVAVSGVFILRHHRYRFITWQTYTLFLLCLVIPISAWIFARYQYDGLTFFKAMAGYDLLRRSSQSLEGHAGGYLFYLYELRAELGEWFPIMAIVAGAHLTKLLPKPFKYESWKPQQPTDLFWIWALVPLSLFSLARTKLEWYINLIYPPVAILVAIYTVGAVRRRPDRGSLKPIGGVIVLGSMVFVAALNERDILHDIGAQARLEDTAQEIVLRLAGEHQGRTLYFGAEPRQAVLFAAKAIKGLQVDVLPRPVFEALLNRISVTDLVAIELVTRKHLARGRRRMLRLGASGDLIMLAAGKESEAFVAKYGLTKIAQSRDWLVAQLQESPSLGSSRIR